jgi:hypothetical protein
MKKYREVIDHAILIGDFTNVSDEFRVQYLKELCESLQLNYATTPFAYIKLKQKDEYNKTKFVIRPYALKNCTDQIRLIHGVSVSKLEKELFNGVYIVTAYVQDKDGRQDADIGASSVTYSKDSSYFDKNNEPTYKKGDLFQGEDFANAIMKATTKAKRRATLSLMGLGGILDESEIESLEGAEKVSDQSHAKETPGKNSKYLFDKKALSAEEAYDHIMQKVIYIDSKEKYNEMKDWKNKHNEEFKKFLRENDIYKTQILKIAALKSQEFEKNIETPIIDEQNDGKDN